MSEGMVILGSAYDPMSARLAEIAGFKAIHVTGMGVEISLLGVPDLSVMTLTELVAHCARMADTVAIPIVSDIETGFGGVFNVQRTIREMERAGIAGVHLEDQIAPKHCPILSGRKVASRAEALDRLKAALDARTDPDLVIIARTDADIISFNEMIDRCNLYLETGADLAMPIPYSIDGKPFFGMTPQEQMKIHERVVSSIAGPMLGIFPPRGYTTTDLANLGFAMTRFPSTAIGAAANAIASVYREIIENGNDDGYIAANPGPYHDPLTLMKAVHLDRYAAIENRFSSAFDPEKA
jgi:methylisocitrate lyase